MNPAPFESIAFSWKIFSQYHLGKNLQSKNPTTQKPLQQSSQSNCVEMTDRSKLKAWIETAPKVEMLSSCTQHYPHFGVSLVRFGRCSDSPGEVWKMLRFPCLGTGNFAAPGTAHIWEQWQRGGGGRGGKEGGEPPGGDGLTARENKLFSLNKTSAALKR